MWKDSGSNFEIDYPDSFSIIFLGYLGRSMGCCFKAALQFLTLGLFSASSPSIKVYFRWMFSLFSFVRVIKFFSHCSAALKKCFFVHPLSSLSFSVPHLCCQVLYMLLGRCRRNTTELILLYILPVFCRVLLLFFRCVWKTVRMPCHNSSSTFWLLYPAKNVLPVLAA